MIKLMKNEKGASSILVILLLIVLVVFGVAALTTALSNVRLGQKVVDWNEKYYAAEAQANEIYAQIDRAIQLQIVSSVLSGEQITNSVEDLNPEIDSTVDENGICFSYETWYSDVGIRVTLMIENLMSGEMTITQWKALQQEQL